MSASEQSAVIRTLLFTDLVDSTRWIRQVGDDDWALKISVRLDRIMRDLVERHGGREIDKSDGFFFLFENPRNAVICALQYHQELAQFSQETAIELEARAGIHVGEVWLRWNPPEEVARGAKLLEVEGFAKPLTARVMSLSHGRQTLLTQNAFDLARRAIEEEETFPFEVRWVCHGKYHIKGMDEPLRIYEVGDPRVAPLRAPMNSDKARLLKGQAPHPLSARSASQQPVLALREWPQPDWPRRPYPLLLPYSHPELLAGRERELAALRRLLSLSVPILGVYAASGAGKSSLLEAGLVPILRREGHPVALDRHPQEAGLAGRLITDLLQDDGSPSPEPASPEPASPGTPSPGTPSPETPAKEPKRTLDALLRVGQLAGKVPVLILDQFEDMLKHSEHSLSRAVLGLLLAASVQHQTGLGTPICRWILAYRQEFHGDVVAWLHNVLLEAQTHRLAIAGLPYDLSEPARFHSWQLHPLGAPVPGADAKEEAERTFLEAIERPLRLTVAGDRLAGDRPRYPWRFAGEGAARLAQTFAEARVARPEAPLTPELQVVLGYLLEESSEADENGVRIIHVSTKPVQSLDTALEDHLLRALETVFPDEERGAREGRSRLLLALRSLAADSGKRGPGLLAENLICTLGDDGAEILERLSSPLTRLIVSQRAPEGWRYVLSHDRMADVIVKMVESEAHRSHLRLDSKLLGLRRLVTVKSSLYHSEHEAGVRLRRGEHRRISAHADALLWTDAEKAWWQAYLERHQAERRRRWTVLLITALLLALAVAGFWGLARRQAALATAREQIESGGPAAALVALHRLLVDPRIDKDELVARLQRREHPLDVLEQGLGGVAASRRGEIVLQVVALTLPILKANDWTSLGVVAWALDFFPGPDPRLAEQTRHLRGRWLALLPPPPRPNPNDPSWVQIPGGTFAMGTAAGATWDEEEFANEQPQRTVTVAPFRLLAHEVTYAEYRRLVPDRLGPDEHPVDNVDWYQAYSYAAWLGGRLPTETEWEYAARAGCRYEYCDSHGDETALAKVGWYSGNATDPVTFEAAPRPVARLEPNFWGLYDMYGNLWEWNADWFQAHAAVPADSPPQGEGRNVRGGAYWNDVTRVRAAYRSNAVASRHFKSLGFRVALPLAPP
jgi:formylglycine-generating enzyme required for sulfatase activity/class 3 adenylate cyclase